MTSSPSDPRSSYSGPPSPSTQQSTISSINKQYIIHQSNAFIQFDDDTTMTEPPIQQDLKPLHVIEPDHSDQVDKEEQIEPQKPDVGTDTPALLKPLHLSKSASTANLSPDEEQRQKELVLRLNTLVENLKSLTTRYKQTEKDLGNALVEMSDKKQKLKHLEVKKVEKDQQQQKHYQEQLQRQAMEDQQLDAVLELDEPEADVVFDDPYLLSLYDRVKQEDDMYSNMKANKRHSKKLSKSSLSRMSSIRSTRSSIRDR
ncbi:unnamed protein product [Ambrosiozyma monospora]|uniref:Unnamed protein product n=1 Tax=Ambrosiozyma monospora TaxID=43982 RepID=A0ACB5T1N2_AMBMO|nr:unnamed protein product [Ambrosiozyma monospora]